ILNPWLWIVALRSATMFFRVKSAGSYQYLQIVHSIRQGEKVRQQVFGTLGRLDELKASGRLEALMRSGLRHCENLAVIDAYAAGETQAVTVQRIGPDLVFVHTTSLYFEGRGGESIGKRGHNKDHRPDLYQMVVGMALDVEGRPICCEMWPGNTADVKTLTPIVKRMRERF